MATIEQRLSAVEAKQDEVVHILQTAGGQLQTIGEDQSLSDVELLIKVCALMIRVGGQLKSIKPRGNGHN